MLLHCCVEDLHHLGKVCRLRLHLTTKVQNAKLLDCEQCPALYLIPITSGVPQLCLGALIFPQLYFSCKPYTSSIFEPEKASSAPGTIFFVQMDIHFTFKIHFTQPSNNIQMVIFTFILKHSQHKVLKLSKSSQQVQFILTTVALLP